MSRPAIKLPAPVDLAPWRVRCSDSVYWAAVEAAAREVTGPRYDTETTNQALARFGYQRATINGVRCVARNGRRVRTGRCDQIWLWLARLKRRLEARGAAR